MDTERVVVGSFFVKQDVTEELIESIVDAFVDWHPGWVYAIQVMKNPANARYLGEIVAKGGELLIWEDVDDNVNGHPRHCLNISVLLAGLAKYAALPEGQSPAQLEEDPPDAVISTLIVQLGIFGEEVYS